MRRILLFFCTFWFFAGAPASAAESPETPLPAPLSAAFEHLQTLVGGSGGIFDPARVGALVDFVLAARPGNALYHEAQDRQGMTSAAYPFTIRTDLRHLLRTSFHPAIPAQVLLPSSIRRASWIAGGDELSRLWQTAPPTQPIIVRAREAEEITPDLITGTYFAYEVDRTLILFTWRGKPVLISLSKQDGPSQVGKKGAVLGDRDWDYFYSGEKGIARAGLGWVDSYMYKAFSIGVFCASDDGWPLVRAAMFKWLSAGWVNMNFVQRQHVYDGLVRFAGDLRSLLEDPQLPSPEVLATTFGRLAQLDNGQVTNFYRRHLQRLEARYGDSGRLSSAFRRQLNDPAYVQRTSRREMEAALSLDIMKCLLGRECPDPQLFDAVRP